MSIGEYCQECRRYHPLGKHNPVFMVRCSEHDGEDDFEASQGIRAFDAEEAAERWAEDWDCADSEYPILQGDIPLVLVHDSEGNVTQWRVSGENVPTYRAEEVEEPTAEEPLDQYACEGCDWTGTDGFDTMPPVEDDKPTCPKCGASDAVYLLPGQKEKTEPETKEAL